MKKVVIIFFILMIFPLSIKAERIKIDFDSCVDGDTIKAKIDGDVSTIRFLAVDTPETVHPKKKVEPFGKEASNYTCNRVKNAKKLELEYDPGSDKTDKYKRTLGWIYVDNSLLQKELIEKGYAKVAYIYGNYLYTDELKDIEHSVKNKKIGVWSVSNDTSYTKENTESEGKSISQIITDFINDLIDDIIKSIKKTIKKEINKLFNWQILFNRISYILNKGEWDEKRSKVFKRVKWKARQYEY